MLKLAANYSLSISRARKNYNFNIFMTVNDIGNVIEIHFEESSFDVFTSPRRHTGMSKASRYFMRKLFLII